jgi:hypothetical protein
MGGGDEESVQGCVGKLSSEVAKWKTVREVWQKTYVLDSG